MLNQTVIVPLYKSCIYKRKYQAALFRKKTLITEVNRVG